VRVDSDRSWRPLPPFIRRTLGWRARRRYRYDDVIPIRIAESTYLLTHPDDVQHVLVGEPTKYEKVPELTSERGRRRAGRGLLTATGDEHLRRRRLLQPLFHRRAVERFERAMASRAEARLGQWSPGMRLDLTSEMEELTRHIILSVVIGGDTPTTCIMACCRFGTVCRPASCDATVARCGLSIKSSTGRSAGVARREGPT